MTDWGESMIREKPEQIEEGGEEEMAKDPVCGMDVDEKTAAATSTYQGKTYYFCAARCKEEFEKEPQKFLKK